MADCKGAVGLGSQGVGTVADLRPAAPGASLAALKAGLKAYFRGLTLVFLA